MGERIERAMNQLLGEIVAGNGIFSETLCARTNQREFLFFSQKLEP